jgi:hypothetical protein
MRREQDFFTYYGRIVTELDDYIRLADREDKDGWQEQAIAFRDLTLRTVTEGSLLELQTKIITFCEMLRSKFNIALNYIVGPFWTKAIGERIGAPGSTLRDKLLAIAYQMQPLHAVYIIDEIQSNKKQAQSPQSEFIYISLQSIGASDEFLSEEGKEIMKIIAGSHDLTTQFIAQASQFSHEVNTQELIDTFKPGRRARSVY